MSLKSFFQRYLPPLEAEIKAVVTSDNAAFTDLFGMLHYHLGWVDQDFRAQSGPTGKRIRPVLCLLACEACGGQWEQAIPAAAAVELLHNFSLIHDDIEDGDTLRRGRSTLWALWGGAQAINAGDALFALSQLAMLRLMHRDVPATRVVQAQQIFNQTCLALTAGQHLDISFETRDDVTVDDYLTMIRGKTAALLTCTCELGALVAGADVAQRDALATFGLHLGLAFQVRDDILGIWGDPKVTGKATGADIARRKKSLPIVHGMTRSNEFRTLMQQESGDTREIARATALLEQAGSRTFAESMSAECHTKAMEALHTANLSGAAAEALVELAQLLFDREH